MYGVVGHSYPTNPEMKKKKLKNTSKHAQNKPPATIRAGVIIGGAVLGCKIPKKTEQNEDPKSKCEVFPGGVGSYTNISRSDEVFDQTVGINERLSNCKPTKSGWRGKFRKKRADSGYCTTEFGGNGSVQSKCSEPSRSITKSVTLDSSRDLSDDDIFETSRDFSELNCLDSPKDLPSVSSTDRFRNEHEIPETDFIVQGNYGNRDVCIPIRDECSVESVWCERSNYNDNRESKMCCDKLSITNEKCCYQCVHSVDKVVKSFSDESSRQKHSCKSDAFRNRAAVVQKYERNVDEHSDSKNSRFYRPSDLTPSLSLSETLVEETHDLPSSKVVRKLDQEVRCSRPRCRTKTLSKSKSDNILSHLEKNARQYSQTRQKEIKKTQAKVNEAPQATEQMVCRSHSDFNSGVFQSKDILLDGEPEAQYEPRYKPQLSKSADDILGQNSSVPQTSRPASAQTTTETARKETPREAAKRRRERDRRRREAALPFLQRMFIMIKRLSGAEDEEEDEGEDFSLQVARHRPEELDKLTRSTKFTRREIQLIYRGFKQECPTGMVDEDGFKFIFDQFFPLGDATKYAHYVFNTFKQNQLGQISFEDFLSALSTVSRGSTQEKLQWIFGLYDVNHDGLISKGEMEAVVCAIYEMLGRSSNPHVDDTTPKQHVEKVFQMIDSNNDGAITIEEFADWIARDETAMQSLSMMDTVLYTRPPHPLVTRPSLSNP